VVEEPGPVSVGFVKLVCTFEDLNDSIQVVVHIVFLAPDLSKFLDGSVFVIQELLDIGEGYPR